MTDNSANAPVSLDRHKTPDGLSGPEYLRQLCLKGLKRRFGFATGVTVFSLLGLRPRWGGLAGIRAGAGRSCRIRRMPLPRPDSSSTSNEAGRGV